MTKAQAYANALYAEFVENAEEMVIAGQTANVWKGSLTRTCAKVGIPKGTERRIMTPLEAMDCIQLLQRGVSNHPTVINLLRPPTEELWGEYVDLGLTSRPTLASMSREVRDIKRTLGGVNLGEALLNLDRRLTVVEAFISGKSQTVERS